ncbi:MAG: Asp-tRNA(Asn)/Glu-tRNA(Gln) amidotransferase subunit GatC [Deltaproteobacteria bacterium]|nr:Asp-tRNA(Asn)/Glu-tRNA(Gln) amidotransferase subunit GatC [Deltaproteobacteria bacterium]
MHFSVEDIKKLAHLSRLDLSEETLMKRRANLEKILDYVEQLQAIDVEGIEPMSHAVFMTQHRRPDEAKAVFGREALKVSAGYEEGLIKVPKIIE